MRIAVLGATGQTGYAFCTLALKNDHQIVAVVRDTNKMNGLVSQNTDQIQVVQTNILDPSALAKNLVGVDAVVSCLGSKFVPPWKEESTFYTDSIISIVSAMRESNVQRLICISAAMLRSDQNLPEVNFKKPTELFKNPSMVFRKFVRTVAVSHLKDMEKMENFLMQSCPDIEYSIMRPYALISKPMSNREVAIETDTDQMENCAFHIYRENLAQEMLNGLEQNLWNQKTVCVAMRC